MSANPASPNVVGGLSQPQSRMTPSLRLSFLRRCRYTAIDKLADRTGSFPGWARWSLPPPGIGPEEVPAAEAGGLDDSVTRLESPEMGVGNRPLAANRRPRGAVTTFWLQAELVAVVIASFCYCNTLINDFCDDGVPIVKNNRKVNDPNQWLAIWTTDYWSDTKDATPNRDLLHRPVALSSYRLVRIIAGTDPFPHLLVNVLLHAINSALVARMCRHMRGSEASAMVAGAVFATLPIHTEVINNVVGRADLLVAFGVLAALLAHRRSMIATTSGAIVRWRILSALAAFVAMGSKENGAAVIPLIVLLDGYWYQPWRAASRDRAWWSIRSLLRFTYLLIPAAVYLGLRYYALEGAFHQKPALTKTVNVLVDAPLWQHLLGVMQLWGMYWAKTFWPQVLCVNYSVNTIHLATDVSDPHVLIGIVITGGLLIASIVAWRKKRRSVAYLFGATLLSYALTSNAWILIQVFFAERIWYLPSIWIAILAALAVLRVDWRPVWCLVGAAVVFAMTERCWTRNAEWKDNETLYASTYEVHRRAVGALRLYGQTLVEQGRLAEGISLLKQALDIDLGFTDAHRSLGHAYLLARDYQSALRHLQIANMQVPDHPPTEQALAFVSQKLSERDETELQRIRAEADAHEGDPEAEAALVRILRDLARTDEALARAPSSQWAVRRQLLMDVRVRCDSRLSKRARSGN